MIDEFTRECLAAEVARTFTSRDVMLTLQYLFAVRGAPEHVRSDNGPPMPPQNRVGRHDRREVRERFAANEFAFHSESTSLVVVEDQAFLADYLQQDLDLGALKFEG
ncbi:MAG TPA: hypothetical protein VHZ24_15475 [Pirellulales bacterium]|nr:hypothetical protein [Pirellulales bacterium]